MPRLTRQKVPRLTRQMFPILTQQEEEEVIDAKTVEGSDADFAAFIDNAEYTDAGEIEPAADTRTLLIGFPAGAGSIDVIGTSVVPEFSTIAVVVLAIAIIGIVIATA